MTTHPEQMDTGAYVLGALRGEERAAFERHLVTCLACQDAVAEVAVLPTMLALVPPDVAADLAEEVPEGRRAPSDPEPPASVLSDLLAAVRYEERRARRRRQVAGAFALAAVLVLGVLVAVRPDLPWTRSVATAPAAQALTLEPVVEGVPVTASVELVAVAWGTRIDLTCSYTSTDRYPTTTDYALVLERSDGTTEQVATWRAVPGGEVTVPASTGTAVGDITAVDLRSVDGRSLLRATT